MFQVDYLPLQANQSIQKGSDPIIQTMVSTNKDNHNFCTQLVRSLASIKDKNIDNLR
jgi:hypothetical protein